jgi:hypothetical protein
MWHKGIEDRNAVLKVHLSFFMLRNKLKFELRAHLHKITHFFKCCTDRAETNEKFGKTFEYSEYLMSKDIYDIIPERDGTRKQRYEVTRAERKRKKEIL